MKCPDCGLEWNAPPVNCPKCIPQVTKSIEAEKSSALTEDRKGADIYRTSNYGVAYNPSIIRSFANELYKQSSIIVLQHTISGVIVGSILGLIISSMLQIIVLPLAVIGGIVGGFLGSILGNAKAFMLKLQAQLALCQVEIEKGIRELNELMHR